MSAPDIESLARISALEAEARMLRELKALREENGLSFYRPHLKQHKFHTCNYTGRFLCTGNRFGKSDCGIAETLAFALGGRIWYKNSFDILDGSRNVVERHIGSPDHPYITQGIPQRPLKILVLVVDWDMAKEVFTGREGSYETWGKLWKMLPKGSYVNHTNGGRGDRIVKIEIARPAEYGGGISTITFDTVESYKHNRMGAESKDWDLIHVDEPVPESLFQAHSRGLMDRDGKFYFTCTPLSEMWIYDIFRPPVGTTLLTDDTFMIEGSIYDNPYRNEEGVRKFEARLSPEERECRLMGKPLNLAGLVYKEFSSDHVLPAVPVGWEEFWLPPKSYTIRVAWDVHGARLPQACLFAATSPDGTVFIYDELFCEPLITANALLLKEKLSAQSKIIKDGKVKVVNVDRNVVSRLIDPRALIVNPVTGTADVLDAIDELGLYFEPASKDLTTGISAVKEKLKERHVLTNLPTIYFSPKLKETLREFSRYVYDTEKNKPKDKDDHMMENLYRLVLNGLEYVAPDGASSYPKRSIAIEEGLELRDLYMPESSLY